MPTQVIDACPDYAIVIPVFNAASTLPSVVQELSTVFAETTYEIVLVNDGSGDDTESVCRSLQQHAPETVRFVQLARNFGEHHAVLAGLRHSRAAFAVVVDDDGQHPAAEALRLLQALRSSEQDVIYGRYRTKQHSVWRNLGSRVTNSMATLLLQKPPELYLSSFKAMNRFVIEQICEFRGAAPYIDGLVYRVTRRIAQIDVSHRERTQGLSNYGPRKLISLWLDSFLNFTILPLRFAGILGFLSSAMSALVLVAIVVDRAWFNTGITQGVPTMIVLMAFFAGIQFLILGIIGEYLGRLFLDQSGSPQYVIRYVLDHERRSDR